MRRHRRHRLSEGIADLIAIAIMLAIASGAYIGLFQSVKLLG